MKQNTLLNHKIFNLSGTSSTTETEIVSCSEESYSAELLDFISYAESEKEICAFSEICPKVSKKFDFEKERLYEPEFDLKPFQRTQSPISLPDLPTSESDFWEQNPTEAQAKQTLRSQTFEKPNFQKTPSACHKSREYQMTQSSGQGTLNFAHRSESNLNSIEMSKNPENLKSYNFERDQKSHDFVPFVEVIRSGSPTAHLEEVIARVLSNKMPSPDQIRILSPSEKILLGIYLNKRMLISDRQLKSFPFMSTDCGPIFSILAEISERSNCNEAGLTETIVNRVLRTCFEEWFDRRKEHFHIFNGKFNFRNKSITNEGVNRLFWEHMLSGPKTLRNRSLDFDAAYSRILSNVQIKKKKIGKSKRKKNISIKQPKYHNIFWKKKLKQVILETLGKNPRFLKNYNLHKSEVLFQYSSLPIATSDVSANTHSLGLSKNKFSFNLKKQVGKAVTQMFEWVREKADANLELDGVFLKKKLKHVACPVTVEDHRVVFLEIERFLWIN